MSIRRLGLGRRAGWCGGLLISLVLFAFAAPAFGLPVIGAARPNLVVADAWERNNEFARYPGMPLLVVYEDSGSVSQNLAFKRQLADLGRGEKYRKAIALFAVADVSGYDYWPVRGLVRGAIQAESHKQGTDIYCDWDGHVRATLNLERGMSNVVLYGKGGDVLFAHAGPMNDAQRTEIMALLREQADR